MSLNELYGIRTAFKNKTVLDIARAMLDGSDWTIEMDAVKASESVAVYVTESGNLQSQLAALAESVGCRAVFDMAEQRVIFVEQANA